MKKIILSFIFFVICLYLVEASSIGSKEVAKYNQGYGTFDMKKYDTETVKTVLSRMDAKGIHVYKMYYLADTLFIIAFGLFQIILSRAVFSWVKQPTYVFVICLIPILRGVADMIENIILFSTLCHYPDVNANWIGVSSMATTIKLLMIKIWVCVLIVGVIGQVLKHYKIIK